MNDNKTSKSYEEFLAEKKQLSAEELDEQYVEAYYDWIDSLCPEFVQSDDTVEGHEKLFTTWRNTYGEDLAAKYIGDRFYYLRR